MKKIYYLWLRQVKKYIRSPIRMVAFVVQPTVFLVMFGYGLGSSFAAGGINYIDYLAPGLIGMSIIFTATFSGLEVIWDRQFGFLKETLVAPMSRTDVMFGRTIGAATASTVQGAITFIVAYLFGFRPVSWSAVLPAFFIVFLIALVFAAFGTILGSLIEDMQAFQLVVNFLVLPLLFISGAFFPLENMPSWLELIARVDPLTYGVDALRVLFADIGHHDLTVPGDTVFLIVLAFICIWLGGYFFEKVQA